MSTPFYDTDLTDAAWAWVAPVLSAARPGGRPRTTNLRAVLNAIFYLLRTGCQWRLLPREFPPCGTGYHYFQAWQNSGETTSATALGRLGSTTWLQDNCCDSVATIFGSENSELHHPGERRFVPAASELIS